MEIAETAAEFGTDLADRQAFFEKEILRIGSALQVMCKENRPQDIRDEDVFIFAELCSELGHLAVYLQSPEVDEKLTDVAEGWISLLVPPRGGFVFQRRRCPFCLPVLWNLREWAVLSFRSIIIIL